MSPGKNDGGRRTGTVPKIKYHNHNDVTTLHDANAVSQHHRATGIQFGTAHFLTCPGSNQSGSSQQPTHLRRDSSFCHMNNNLGSSMDWQPMPDVTSQAQSRTRKESNTSGVFDLTGISGNSSIVGGSTSEGLNGSHSDFTTFVQQPPNKMGDNEDMNGCGFSGKWDQDGASGMGSVGSGNSSVVKKQQKSNNISEQAQVAARLHQIRDYIGQTSSVMERLQAAGTPQHMEQWLRLSTMLDGLRDSEIKLAAIQSKFVRLQALEDVGEGNYSEDDDDDNNEDDNVDDGDVKNTDEVGFVPKSIDQVTRRNELKIKVEESQKKFIELKEQQAALLAVKQRAQEKLRETRAIQGALLAAQEQRGELNGLPTQDCNNVEDRIQCLHHFYETRNELAQLVNAVNSDSSADGEVIQLQNKLEELQTKKMQIDQMVTQINLLDSSAATVLGSNTNTDAGVQVEPTFEEKVLELATLKDQLHRMQTALSNMSAPVAASSSSTTTSAANLRSNSQELENYDDEEEVVNLHFKQDNRTQAISQNQIQQPAVSMAVLPAPLSASTSIDNRRESPTNIVQQQQQLRAKSLKLQEAKARLYHLQELLSLVEEFREAGKPVPEKILQLLNSPNGPLSNEDNLDLEPQEQQSQPQTRTSLSSSSTSSVLSLIQQSTSSGNNTFNSTSNRDLSLQTQNRSDLGHQNFYQPVVTSTLQQEQKPLRRQQQNQQSQLATATKQIKNNVTKSCKKTQDLEEWMKKEDPMSCINTDVHSQQQQQGAYVRYGFAYQEGGAACAPWTDYSSDDAGGTEDENEQDYFISKAEAVSNANIAAVAGTSGLGGATTTNTSTATVASGPSSVVCKEPFPPGYCPPIYTAIPRDDPLESGSGLTANGNSTGLQSCSTKSCLHTPRNQVWRKHSTGSGSSLPSNSATNRGNGMMPPVSSVAPHGVWTPTACCCYNRRQESGAASTCNSGGIDDMLARSHGSHHTADNTNWIVHQINQLQTQLQQMGQIVNDKYTHNLIMSPSHNMSIPTLPFCHPSNTPPLQAFGAAGGFNNYLAPHQPNILNVVNQCCQLMWHQQCELASLKENLHALQQQYQCQVPPRCAGGGSPSAQNEGNNEDPVAEHHSSHSNIERCPLQSQQRNRLTTSPPTPQPPLISVPPPPPPPHYFYPPYGNNLNLSFQPFQSSSPVGSFMPSPTGTLNNQVPPGNRANNYWDNFRSYSRQNLLSVRSKCNEGRGTVTGLSVGEATGTTGQPISSGGSAGNSNSALGTSQQIQQPQSQQISQQQSNTSLDDVMTHNISNHKEKLNVSYQSHSGSAQCVNNNRMQQSLSTSSLMIDQQQRGAAPANTAHESASTSLKCYPSKGACKKSCRIKDSQLQRGSGASSYDHCNNPNINTNNNSNRSWNCNSSGGSRHTDCLMEQNTINNRHQTVTATTATDDDLPRNSNCKRSFLMNASSGTVAANTNKYKLSPVRMESNDLLDSLEESMYSEVAALISVNEQRPSYLLQLFKDLKQISSDSDRQAALITIHSLANRPSGLSTSSPGLFTASSPIQSTTQPHNPEEQQNNSGSLKVCSSSRADGDNSNVQDNECNDRRYHRQQQPRNVSWRYSSKDFMSLSSALPMNCRKLDWEVQSILINILPFLKMHLTETCTQSLLESIRNLVLQLVPSPQNSPGQLDALLEDALFKFQGCRLRDVCDELVTVVAEVLISELTFLRLITTVNNAAAPDVNGSDYCVVEDEEEEGAAAEEEGAVGGIDRLHHDMPTGDHSASNQITRCSKSDTVVSDAELAEADQSSRHTATAVAGNSSNCIGFPMASNPVMVPESNEPVMSRTVEENGRENPDYNNDVEDMISLLPGSNVESGCNSSSGVINNNTSNNLHKKNNTISNGVASSASSICEVDVWAVEEDREQLLDQVPTRLNSTSIVPNGIINHSGHDQEQRNDASLPSNYSTNNSSNNSDSHSLAAV